MQDLCFNIRTSKYQAVSAETLCVSGIYDSNVKYKYSRTTLEVTVWQKWNSCIACL